MYCKHCGREIDDNSSYCKYCGKSQDLQNQVDNSINLRGRLPIKINKTAIADGIIAVFKEVLILLLLSVSVFVLFSLFVYFVLNGDVGDDAAVGVLFLILTLIAIRYIIKLVKWVNKHKSKKYH